MAPVIVAMLYPSEVIVSVSLLKIVPAGCAEIQDSIADDRRTRVGHSAARTRRRRVTAEALFVRVRFQRLRMPPPRTQSRLWCDH